MKVVWEPTEQVRALIVDIDKTLYSGENGDAFIAKGSEKERTFLAQFFSCSVDEIRSRIAQTKEIVGRRQGHSASLSQTVIAMGVPAETWNRVRNDFYVPEEFLVKDPSLVMAMEVALEYFPVVIATNSPKRVGERVLRTLGMESLLGRLILIGPEDAGCPKPEPAYFTYALSQANGYLPKDFLAIGDREDNDLWPAIAAGAGGAVRVEHVEETTSLLMGLAHQRKLGRHQSIISIPQLVQQAYRKGKVTILGLTGQAGCGKSTLARRLVHIATKFKIPVAMLGLDAFFRLSSRDRRAWLAEGEGISVEEGQRRRDQILWWNFEKAETALRAIKGGQGIHLTGVYNRADKGELTGEVVIPASDEKGFLLIFEGVATAHLTGLSQRIYLNVSPDIRFERLLARDRDRRPQHEEMVARFQLTEKFERGYFQQHWGHIDMFLDNAALVPSLQSGLRSEEALGLASE